MPSTALAPPLTPIIDPVTGTVTEIGRRYLRLLGSAIGALAPTDAPYWVSSPAAALSAEQNLGALASGYLKLAVAIGIATPSTVTSIPQADVTGLVAALAAKAALASPALTGTPTAPTAAPGTNTTQVATTAYVLANPGSDATKAPLASPTFTGTPAAPTAGVGTNTTQLATTAFVLANAGGAAWTPVTFAAGNFTASGSLVWTVDAGDVVTYAYRVQGKTMTVAFTVYSSTLSGTTSHILKIAIPASAVATRQIGAAMVYYDGVSGDGIAEVLAGGTTINIMKNLVGTSWTLNTNATYVEGVVTFEIN